MQLGTPDRAPKGEAGALLLDGQCRRTGSPAAAGAADLVRVPRAHRGLQVWDENKVSSLQMDRCRLKGGILFTFMSKVSGLKF
ncbi:MAG: hypothetical protein WAqTSA_41990 [Shewanella algae]